MKKFFQMGLEMTMVNKTETLFQVPEPGWIDYTEGKLHTKQVSS